MATLDKSIEVQTTNYKVEVFKLDGFIRVRNKLDAKQFLTDAMLELLEWLVKCEHDGDFFLDRSVNDIKAHALDHSAFLGYMTVIELKEVIILFLIYQGLSAE